MGLSFTVALASAVILEFELFGTHDHILLSQIRDSPNLEGQVPVFLSPRNRVAQLYAQALDFLFISYDSQGKCGGIRTRIRTRPALNSQFVPQREHRLTWLSFTLLQ
jgi:hypothetical protein